MDLLGLQASEKIKEPLIVQDSPENWGSWATFNGPEPNQHSHTAVPHPG